MEASLSSAHIDEKNESLSRLQQRQNCSNNVKLTTRKSKKFLTTCKQCGHYRFAKMNCKRTVNPYYPYEHSTKGGCSVSIENHIMAGQKLRRKCNCVHCTEAVKMFKNEVPVLKKKNQYIYTRTAKQNFIWVIMKRNGWRCRYGRYFRPGESLKGEGMSADETFDNVEALTRMC